MPLAAAERGPAALEPAGDDRGARSPTCSACRARASSAPCRQAAGRRPDRLPPTARSRCSTVRGSSSAPANATRWSSASSSACCTCPAAPRRCRSPHSSTSNMDEIVAEWEAFARTLLPAAATMSSFALRDHAEAILQAIAQEIQRDPAVAHAPAAFSRRQTAATAHGALRHLSGFNLLQLGSEYRALTRERGQAVARRTCRRSITARSTISRASTQSVDQALAESIASYADELARSRDTFLAILGHDLRSPLSAVSMSGHYLSQDGDARRQAGAAGRGAHPARRARRWTRMVKDLLEYTRTRLGRGIPIVRQACDIATPLRGGARRDEGGSSRSRVPLRDRRATSSGAFDGARLEQVFAQPSEQRGAARRRGFAGDSRGARAGATRSACG